MIDITDDVLIEGFQYYGEKFGKLKPKHLEGKKEDEKKFILNHRKNISVPNIIAESYESDNSELPEK